MVQEEATVVALVDSMLQDLTLEIYLIQSLVEQVALVDSPDLEEEETKDLVLQAVMIF